MTNNTELRTAATKVALDAFEKERDKLLDQLANLKGQADRLEWVIKVLLNQVTQIEQEETILEQQRKQQETMLEQQRKQQEEAMKSAREAGNVGTHPSERKADLAERKQQAKATKSKKLT